MHITNSLVVHLIFHVITLTYLFYNNKIGVDSCGFEQVCLRADNLKHITFKRDYLDILQKSKSVKYEITLHCKCSNYVVMDYKL